MTQLCRCSKWLTISINLLGQNYQHLTTSAYVLLCLCVSENQPLVFTAVKHILTLHMQVYLTCVNSAEMRQLGQGTVVLN